MSPATYHSLVNIAGEWALKALPHRLDIINGCAPSFSVAIYIAMNAVGDVDYVGSVVRPGNDHALRDRIREHLHDRRRATRWTHLYVIPLVPEIPAATVRHLEGEVGTILRPSRNRRLPRASTRRPALS